MKPDKIQSKGLLRRQIMLDIATGLFLKQGYGHTSLSEIIACSKGSRSTIYKYFGSKYGLLQAMIQQVAEETCSSIEVVNLIEDLDEDKLVDLGVHFLGAILSPNALGVYRIVISEVDRSPYISEYFHNYFIKIILEQFSKAFGDVDESLMAENGLFTSVRELSSYFLWAVAGEIHFLCAIGKTSDWDDERIKDVVRARVRFFLNGIRAR